MDAQQTPNNKLFIANLAWAATEADLTNLLSEYGEVQLIKIPKDFNSGRSRGYAFVEMSSVDEAIKVVTEMDGQLFHGRPLAIKYQEERQRNANRPESGAARSFEPHHAGSEQQRRPQVQAMRFGAEDDTSAVEDVLS